MAEETVAIDTDNTDDQAARAFLRRRFLEALVAMGNKRVEFSMHGHTKVTAVFGTSDIDIMHFQVSNLQTPIGVQDEALLRCSDIISFTFDAKSSQMQQMTSPAKT